MIEKQTKQLTLDSGFTFDYGNLVGEGKVKEQDLAALSQKLKAAHAAISHMRQTGEVTGHLSKDGTPEPVLFTELPFVTADHLNSPSSLARLKEFSASLRYHTDAVISFGIGGSFLGNKVLFDVHCGEFWNSKSAAERDGYPKLYFSGNNIDPLRTSQLISQIEAEAKVKAAHFAAGMGDSAVYELLLVVISKSGSTLDTMSNFLVAYEQLKQNPAISLQVVAVTDPAEGHKATLLKKLAQSEGWTTFSVPDGVGGRFSVFSEVGLVTGACIGFDIDAFLAGAKAMDEACRSEVLTENPAMLNAAIKYVAAKEYGRHIEVFMPYGDYLKSTAEWYIQLLAESLGKRTNRAGETVYYGRTPVVAVGTTDMHSQTQLHQDGSLDKVVQFVEVLEWPIDPVIPNLYPEIGPLAAMAGIPMSKALQAALLSNAEALAKENRLNGTFQLPKLSAYHLGELLYLLALSIAYEGELAQVDAFDQPGVEAYKRILGPKLKEYK
ncbi:MAG: glucose-6-phosphate isomerase [Sporomusaceae bacterium]|nr:glucose-6-phosphate isomerase [Sporomusaceae bacterium]